MPRFKFNDIAFNITDKKMPEDGDEKMYIGLEHLDSGSLKVSRWGSEVKLTGQKLVMKKGDLLFGRRNTYLRRAAIAPHDGIFSAHGMILRPKTEVIDPDFFPFFISSNYFMDAAIRISVGSLSPTVNWKTLKELEFDLPSLEEQKKTAELLKAINETKEAYQELLTLTDDLVKSQFIEMFGDPFTNEGGWKSGEIGDYFKVKGGKRIPKGMTFSSEVTEHPYLRTTDMKNGTIIDDDIHYIDEEVFSHITRYTVSGGDIYLTNVGVNLGMAGIIPEKYDGASLTENAVKLLPITDSLIPEFVSTYINMPQVQKYIDERKMAVGVPKLAIFRIESMPVIIPPKQLQQNYLGFVHQSDKSKFELKKSIESTDNLMKAILYSKLEQKGE